MRARLLAPLLISLAACSGNEGLSPAPVPLEVAGGFSVTLRDPGRLVVASADGRTLLDGLPPGAVADDAPPLVGFAVRDVTTTYEMQFGSFRPDETANGPWRVGQKLLPSAGGVLDVQDASGKRLARIRFQTPQKCNA